MHKNRSQHQEAEIFEVVGDIAGKTCIIFDDIIDTAGTLLSGKNALMERGAKEVFAVATHAVFSGKAVERLTEAHFREVIVTDSIPTNPKLFPGLTILPIAPLLAEVIRHVISGQSVTDIYKK